MKFCTRAATRSAVVGVEGAGGADAGVVQWLRLPDDGVVVLPISPVPPLDRTRVRRWNFL